MIYIYTRLEYTEIRSSRRRSHQRNRRRLLRSQAGRWRSSTASEVSTAVSNFIM